MFARTERLLLRPAWSEDSEALFRAIADERIVRNLATAPWPYLPEHAATWTGAERSADRPASLIFLRTAGAPQLIGGIGIHDMPSGEVELGYWIARPHWGCGYAGEAGRPVLGFARHALRLKRLVAGHFLDNPASGSVLRKLGFRPTGVIGMRHSMARGAEAPMAEFVLELNRAEDEEPSARACPLAA
ncbi:MAG TPA: GNAT family N-acetyltransferase [Allosphingosinicella sp.]|jgi:RimJ/RimL family protein N-acetyltransferase